MSRGDAPEMVTLGEGATAVSSVVLVRDDGSILVGASADRRGIDEPGRVARHFKRRIGDPAPLAVGSSRFPAHVLLGKLLRWVLDRVAEREGEPATTVAVTHPANWGSFKLEHLHQALDFAGVPDALILSEPEAAAIQYASHERVAAGSHVAVYDLGGGTFDAAVLRKNETGFSIIGEPKGIEQLGGIDFDDVVFDHVAASLGRRFHELDGTGPATIAALARLRRECEAAKIDLSVTTESTISVSLPGIQERVRITREEFETAIRPMIADTIGALQRAIASAGLTPEDLAAVLLVGGSSRIPLVAQMVTQALGRPVAVDADPKNTIALGAARHAASAETEQLPAADPAPAPAPERGPGPTPQPRRRMGLVVGVATAAIAATVAAIALWPSGDGGSDTTVAATSTGVPETTSAPGTTTTSVATTAPPDAPQSVVAFYNELDTAQIMLSTLDGSTLLTISSGNGGNFAPAISPDGTRIAFSSNRLDGNFEIFVMDIDGSDVVRVTESPGNDGHPAWSPDSTRLVFRSDRNGNEDLFVIDLVSGALTQLTDDPELEAGPDWSPDGSRIVYQGVVDGLRQLFTVAPDGSDPVRLTDSGSNDTRPTWSPDGAFVAFESDRTGNNDIFVLEVGTGIVTRLTTSPSSDEAPDWSPDGTEIVFESDRAADRDIHVMPIDISAGVVTADEDSIRLVAGLEGDDRRPSVGSALFPTGAAGE